MTGLSRLWTTRSLRLAAALGAEGREARIVGGAVRDALAGRPCNDTDVATDATPREMLEIGARLGIRTIPTLAEVDADAREWDKGGLRHGTVPFVIDGEVIEATTLRVDVSTDGRHAEVAFVREFDRDAGRRDLTFNAMSVDACGRLHDPFGGAADLASGTVRFVGDADTRIREDYLRILRYFRFRASFGAPGVHGAVEAETEAAIRRNADGLLRISGERIWQEMSRVLPTREGLAQLPGMRRTGVADAIGLPVRPVSLASAAVAARHGATAPVVLGILLSRDVASSSDHEPEVTAADLKARWKLSTDEADLVEFVRVHANMAAAPFDDFLRLATRPRQRPVHVSDLLVGLGRPDDAVRLLADLPVFPVRGADLVSGGHAAGPEIGQALASLHAAWVGSGFKATREELLSGLADRHGKSPGGGP